MAGPAGWKGTGQLEELIPEVSRILLAAGALALLLLLILFVKVFDRLPPTAKRISAASLLVLNSPIFIKAALTFTATVLSGVYVISAVEEITAESIAPTYALIGATLFVIHLIPTDRVGSGPRAVTLAGHRFVRVYVSDISVIIRDRIDPYRDRVGLVTDAGTTFLAAGATWIAAYNWLQDAGGDAGQPYERIIAILGNIVLISLMKVFFEIEGRMKQASR